MPTYGKMSKFGANYLIIIKFLMKKNKENCLQIVPLLENSFLRPNKLFKEKLTNRNKIKFTKTNPI